MLYAYKARDRGGRVLEGTIESPTEQEALSVLMDRGLFVSSLKKYTGGSTLSRTRDRISSGGINTDSGGGLFGFNPFKPKPPTLRDLAVFCDQGSNLIRSGVPVLSALRVLARQAQGKRLSTILNRAAEEVEQGATVSQGLAQHQKELPASLVTIVGVAEVAGNLDEGLGLLGTYYDQEDQFNSKVKSAMVYPTIVLGVTGLVTGFMLGWVVPQYAGMFKQMGANLPAATILLLDIANAVKNYWWLFLALMYGLYKLYFYAVQSSEALGIWHAKKTLKTPVFGNLWFYREIARFCRTLATLLRSGVPILQGLVVSQQTLENAYLAKIINGTVESVQNGEPLVHSLRQANIFPPVLVEMIAVGEQTGNVEENFFKVAQYAEKDVATTLERLSSALEPILVVTLGVIVTLIIIPMLLPIFDMLNTIR